MSAVGAAALLAMLPAMIGPLPAGEGENALLLALCGGGQISVQIDHANHAGADLPGTANTPCCAKGCRGGRKRKVLDLRQ